MTLMGPSPFMTQGYVLYEDGQVQHARVAVSTDPQAERRAVLELQSSLWNRRFLDSLHRVAHQIRDYEFYTVVPGEMDQSSRMFGL